MPPAPPMEYRENRLVYNQVREIQCSFSFFARFFFFNQCFFIPERHFFDWVLLHGRSMKMLQN